MISLTKLNLSFFGFNIIFLLSIILYHTSFLQTTLLTPHTHNTKYHRRLQTPDHITPIQPPPFDNQPPPPFYSDNSTNLPIPIFNPLNPLTPDELYNGINLVKQYFNIELSDNKTIAIHTWFHKLNNKYSIIDYLHNPFTKLTINDFPRLLSMDISLKTGTRIEYYTIIADISNEKITKLKQLTSNTGYPNSISKDGQISRDIILNSTNITNYFIHKLNMKEYQLNNIICGMSTPFKKYIVYKLKNIITNIEYLFNNFRLGIVTCYDHTFIIESPTQNQIPFLGLINLDKNELIYYWECDNNDMNLDCINAAQYNAEFYFGNEISLNDIIGGQYNISLDKLNECKVSQLFNQSIPRPRVSLIPDNGTTFEINDHIISWQEWTFHEQLNIRWGPHLSDVRFRGRSIAYEIHLSDIYVPYHDLNSIQWYTKVFLDISHFGAGLSTTPFVPLSKQECPESSFFFTQPVMLEDGSIVESMPYACLFERYTGEPRVRHSDFEYINTAPNMELVYRTILTVGNYDYLISYEFRLDASINVKIGATGYNLISQINKNINKYDRNANTKQFRYCNKLSENYCSPFHDHFFSFRVDMDVDETRNNFIMGKMIRESEILNDNSRFHNQFMSSFFDSFNERRNINQNKLKRNSYFYQENIIEREEDTKSTRDPYNPGHWVFRSTSKRFNNEKINSQTGYEIMPMASDILIWDAQTDIRDNMAGWTNYGMWVTKYKEDEYFSSGQYTWQPIEMSGIPEYSQDNEYIKEEDVVAWVNIGFHHITRSDDMPMMYLMPNSFLITPFNFFSKGNSVTCGDDIY